MSPFQPQSFTGEFDAVPGYADAVPPSHDLAAFLPEMLEESQTFLAAYCAGLLTAPEYVLLDVLGGAAVTEGVSAPIPRAALAVLPDAETTLESLLRMGLVRITADTAQLAPQAVALVADAIDEVQR